jgi:hypothetical protein
MWGAFAARLARDYLNCDYQAAGQQVNEFVRFGYYYPTQGAPDSGPDCWPWDDQIEEFTWRYLQSFMSTSLRDGRSKLDGSLHEVEYIAPFTREKKEVWMTGPLWVKDSETAVPALMRDPKSLQAFLLRLAVGADRGNGWGRFSDAHVCLLADGKPIPGTGWCWTELSGNISMINPHAKANLVAHLKIPIPSANSASSAQVDLERWSLEPFVGRTTQAQGDSVSFGSGIPPAVICAAPGSVAASGKCFSVGDLGIWGSI